MFSNTICRLFCGRHLDQKSDFSELFDQISICLGGRIKTATFMVYGGGAADCFYESFYESLCLELCCLTFGCAVLCRVAQL